MFNYKDFLEEATAILEATKNCREDMHEPDEQGLTARVDGKHFDNAGPADEMHVVLWKVIQNVETRHNLASLIALARIGAAKVIEMSNTEPSKPGTVGAMKEWLAVRSDDEFFHIREMLATRGHDYKLKELPNFGTTIYIERDRTADIPRRIVGRKVVG